MRVAAILGATVTAPTMEYWLPDAPGVYAVIADTSEAAHRAGLTMHVVKAGDAKGIGVQGTEFTDDQKAEVQRHVDAHRDLFVQQVAEGRGFDLDKAMALADGRMHIGAAAKDVGLIDGVKNLSETLRTARTLATQAAGKRAPMNRDRVRATHKEPAMAEQKTTEASMDIDIETAPEATTSQEQDNRQVVDVAAVAEAAAIKAVQADRKRRTEIAAAIADYPDLVAQADGEGLSVDQAKALAFGAAQTRIGELGKELVAAQGRLKIAADAGLVEPLAAATDAEVEKPNPYEQQVLDKVVAGVSADKARFDAGKQFPAEHKAWLAGQQPAPRATA